MFWTFVAVAALIGLNAFFVAAEYAVVATRTKHIDAMRRAGKTRPARAMETLKRQTASSIGTIQVCITATNLLLGWLGEPAMSAALRSSLGSFAERIPDGVFTPISITLSFLVVTLLTVVFSELVPKAVTLRHITSAAALTAQPVLAISRAVWPLVWLMNKLANLVTVPLGLGRVDAANDERVTTAEIRVLTTEAAEEGELTPRESSVILNALTLADRTASQIMVPRVRIAYLDLKRSMEDNRTIINQRLYSRLPVCNGGMDNVLGVVHTKEFLSAYNAAGDVSVLGLIAREPIFVPESITIDRLLSLFAETHSQMVFVLDEYGGVSGLVTLRDVVDRVLGAGLHPRQVREAMPAGAVAGPGLVGVQPFIVEGDMHVVELAQRLNQHDWCSHETAATLAGLLQDRLGHFPAAGETIEAQGVKLRVVEADEQRRLHIEVTPAMLPVEEG